MKPFFTWSIRTHLLVLVLAAAVPAFALVFWSGLELERHAVDKAKDTATRLVQGMRTDLTRVEGSTRTMLATLAQVPTVRALDLPGCTTLFSRLVKDSPDYSNIFLVTLDGRLGAAALPIPAQLNVTDRRYFRDALRHRSFAVGDYAVSRTSKLAVLHFATPVLDDSGKIIAVVGAAYNLASLSRAFNLADLPEGSAMALTDSTGIRLYRFPEPEKWAGQPEDGTVWDRFNSVGEEATLMTSGADGMRRLYAIKRLRLHKSDDHYMLARVGIPEERALAGPKALLMRNMALMAGAVGLSALLAWTLGNVIIVRRFRRLRDAADRLGRGDLGARSGIGHQEGDMGRLAESFDNMALALDVREAERLEFEQKLRHQSLYDTLTGLANRTLALDRIQQAMERFRRREDVFYAVVSMDLDRFKIINDSLGHSFGDQVIEAVARRIVGTLRGLDTVARFGGNEFVLLLEELATPGEAIRIIKRLRAAVMEPLEIAGREVQTSASFGVVLSPNTFERAEELLQSAAIALHQVKSSGRGRFKVFTPRMYKSALDRLTMEQELRQALEHEEFKVFYQPIWSLNNSQLVGFEALARWQHPERGLVGPGSFISLAEETGIILDLGRVVLRHACADLAEWRKDDPAARDLFVAVNLSNKQFAQFDLVEQVAGILQETGLPADRLKLEITESNIMINAESALIMLNRLKHLGVQISIDDFGTGYSSLSYLQRFPVDTLKVDRSFIGRLGLDPENMEIVRAILALAHSLGLDVVAEGVEEREQATMLRSLGCEFVQGFYFARPLEVGSVAEAISQGPTKR